MAEGRTKVGAVSIEITGDDDKFIATLRQTEQAAKRTGKRISDEFSAGTLATKSWNNALSSSQGLLLGLVAIGSIAALGKQALQAADEFQTMRNKLGLVVKVGENLYDVERKLFDVAQANKQGLGEVVTLYTKLRNARKDLSDEAARDIVDKWSKTLLISGASATEAAAATLQFAQAMASGRLQGDELRSILENNNRFSTLLAEGLGVTVGELRKMGAEGELTTDKIVEAMKRGGGKLAQEAAGMQMTVGQAWGNLGNAMTRLIGLLDQAAGFTQGLANGIKAVADAVEWLTKTLGGNVSAVKNWQVQQKAINKLLDDTSTYVKVSGIDEFGKSVEENLDPLGRTEKQLAAIRDRMEETGQAAKNAQQNLLNIAKLDTIIAREKLIKERDDQQKKLDSYGPADNRDFSVFGAAGAIQQANQKGRQDATAKIQELGKKISETEDYLDRINASITAVAEAPAKKFKPKKVGEDDKDDNEKTKKQLDEYRSDVEEVTKKIRELREAGADFVGDKSRAGLKILIDYLAKAKDSTSALILLQQIQGETFDLADEKSLGKALLNPQDVEIFFREYNKKLAEAEDNQFKPLKIETDSPYDPSKDKKEQPWDKYLDDLAHYTAQGFAQGIMDGDWSSAFEDILGGVLNSVLSDAIKNLGDQIAKLFTEMDWTKILETGNSWLSSIGTAIFGGARASGGKAKGGTSYTVNETKKERFVSKATGASVDIDVMPGQKFIAPEDGWIVPRDTSIPGPGALQRSLRDMQRAYGRAAVGRKAPYGGARAASMTAPVPRLTLTPERVGGALIAKAVSQTYTIGGFTFNNYGRADAVTKAELGEAFASYQKSLPGALQVWKQQRQMRGDLL